MQRNTHTLEFKLNVIKFYHESGKNAKFTKRSFNLKATKSVRDWLKIEDKIMKIPMNVRKHRRTIVKEYATFPHSELYNELDDWYSEMTS